MADRYEIISWRGVRLDRYTVSTLERAEAISGIRISPTQGSYNRGGVSQSAGTHDGGGAVDIVVVHLSRDQMNRLNRALREVGFASWIREKIPGLWNIHIHAILVGNTQASLGALNQVTAYRNGRNGLANNGLDDFGWRPSPITDAPYGNTSTGGFLMALSDKQQTELLTRTRNIDAWISGGGPGVDKGDAKPGTIAARVIGVDRVVTGAQGTAVNVVAMVTDIHRFLGAANATKVVKGAADTIGGKLNKLVGGK